MGSPESRVIIYVKGVYSRMTLVSIPMKAEEGSRTGKRAMMNFSKGQMATWSIL